MTDSSRNRSAACVVAAAVAAMFLWTRGIWPDVLVDFGHEIYVFWRISRGEVLYRDIAHLKGPLSPYFNGLCFRFFGESLRTLVLTNLALLLALAFMLHRILARIAGSLVATLAVLTLVLVFGFSQQEEVGSYNFLCPYSHEVTHGITLAVAAVYLLAAYTRLARPLLLGGAGLATGLASLTDGPVFLAALVSITVGVVLTLWLDPVRRGRAAVLFLAGLALPPLAAFSLLSLALPAREALLGTLGSLRFLVRGEVIFERLYRWQMGTLDLGASLRALALWSLWYVAAFLPAILLGTLVRRRRGLATLLAVALFVVAAATLLFFVRIPWERAFRPLPLVVLLVAQGSLVALARSPRTLAAAGESILTLSFACLALGLMAKVLLNVRVMDYGFALAMPGTLLLVAVLFRFLPQAVERRGANPAFVHATACVLWTAMIASVLSTTGHYVAWKSVRVGEGSDAFRADPRGTAVNMVLDFLARRARPGDTLAVMPEGAILNYLARETNPTPYPVLAPPEVVLYGEERMLRAFEQNPPTRVVLVHADSSIHGVRFFGRDYARKIHAWVLENYRTVGIVGARPFVDERFGIQILERAPPTDP